LKKLQRIESYTTDRSLPEKFSLSELLKKTKNAECLKVPSIKTSKQNKAKGNKTEKISFSCSISTMGKTIEGKAW
jgi:hypothetical protein